MARRVAGLSPCPSWCLDQPKGHRQSVLEGQDIEDVGHDSREFVMRLDMVSNPYNQQVLRHAPAHLELLLRQSAQAPFGGLPFIQVDISTGVKHDHSVNLELLSGEARSLARMLKHLADLRDLHT